MSDKAIHGKRRVFSASNALQVVGETLAEIKREDRLTYADLGRVLGKGEDQASKYCDAAADMGLVSFLLAWREFNGRLIGPVRRFVEESRPGKGSDRAGQCKVLEAALAMSVALADDDAIVREEVRKNRATLEAARDAIDEQLRKLVAAA